MIDDPAAPLELQYDAAVFTAAGIDPLAVLSTERQRNVHPPGSADYPSVAAWNSSMPSITLSKASASPA